MYVFCDLETTGLKPIEDHLVLEAAFIATDANLNPYAEFEVVIDQSSVDPNWVHRMDDFVLDMHRKNNLLKEIESGYGVSPLRAEQLAIEWLSKIGMPLGEVRLGGSNIRFDRGFLQHYFPSIDEMFHYRSVDVSTIKTLAVDWAPLSARWPSVPDDKKAHRALLDCHESICELKHYKREIFDRVPNRHSVDL